MNMSPRLQKAVPKLKHELSKFARQFGGDEVLDEHNSDELNKNNDHYVGAYGQQNQMLSKR